MYTKDSLIAQLRDMLPSSATVLMHSSCRSVGPMENGGDTLLDALCDYFSDGLVALPTHTWALVNKKQPVYDVLETPTHLGVLPELFRTRKGVLRSWHPTHSIAAYGADAWDFLRGDEESLTPCGPGSAWGRLYDRDAYVLLVGVELDRMTYFHCVEEMADIPGRVDMEHPNRYVVIPPEGPRIAHQYFPHGSDSSHLFPKVDSEMLRCGAMTLHQLGDATVRVVSARRSADELLKILKHEPYVFGVPRP